MTHARRAWWRSWIAVAAAYALVLQVVLAGLVAGVAAAPVAGPFAQVLCLPSGADHPATEGERSPRDGAGLCALACALAGSAMAASAAAGMPSLPLGAGAALPGPPAGDPVRAPWRAFRFARAPPA